MYDELVDLNRHWEIELVGRPLQDTARQLQAAGIQFVWDYAPGGNVRFTARNPQGETLSSVTAWIGASYGVIATQVLEQVLEQSPAHSPSTRTAN